MRNATLTILCFVAIGYAADAQRFSLLPQVGFENSKPGRSANARESYVFQSRGKWIKANTGNATAFTV